MEQPEIFIMQLGWSILDNTAVNKIVKAEKLSITLNFEHLDSEVVRFLGVFLLPGVPEKEEKYSNKDYQDGRCPYHVVGIITCPSVWYTP